jgi:hypothetical protein
MCNKPRRPLTSKLGRTLPTRRPPWTNRTSCKSSYRTTRLSPNTTKPIACNSCTRQCHQMQRSGTQAPLRRLRADFRKDHWVSQQLARLPTRARHWAQHLSEQCPRRWCHRWAGRQRPRQERSCDRVFPQMEGFNVSCPSVSPFPHFPLRGLVRLPGHLATAVRPNHSLKRSANVGRHRHLRQSTADSQSSCKEQCHQ